MTESELAESLGIKKLALTKFRKKYLEVEKDWKCESGFPVEYTEEGLEKVRAKFALDDAPEEPKEVVGVVLGFPRNPTLVQMQLGSRQVMCRVRARHLYVKGMEVPMVPKLSVGGAEMYQVMGQPKRKGRWT